MVDPARPSRTNELTVLGEFILKHSRTDFDHDIAFVVGDAGDSHDPWAASCPVGHLFEDISCTEWERAASLGIGWLKSRVQEASNGS